jgi:NAD-dependent SIR2 family protein deacetylase
MARSYYRAYRAFPSMPGTRGPLHKRVHCTRCPWTSERQGDTDEQVTKKSCPQCGEKVEVRS